MGLPSLERGHRVKKTAVWRPGFALPNILDQSGTKFGPRWYIILACVWPILDFGYNSHLEVQRQISPWLRKHDRIIVGMTFSSRASGKMMAAFFPPISKLSFFIIGAARAAIFSPEEKLCSLNLFYNIHWVNAATIGEVLLACYCIMFRVCMSVR